MPTIEQRLRDDKARWIQELEQLRADAENIARRISFLNDKVDYVSALLSDVDATAPSEKPQSAAGETAIRLSGVTTVKAIEHVLRENGSPMRIKDIVVRMLERGFGGNDPDATQIYDNVSSILSRAAREHIQSQFAKIDRGVFTLKELAE